MVIMGKDVEDVERNGLEVLNSFLALCSEGIYSTVMNIRVMCCRLVFLLMKLIPDKKM
jgi:hypothetical protein